MDPQTERDSQPSQDGPLDQVEWQAGVDRSPEELLGNTAEQVRDTPSGRDSREGQAADELARGAERAAEEPGFGREGQ